MTGFEPTKLVDWVYRVYTKDWGKDLFLFIFGFWSTALSDDPESVVLEVSEAVHPEILPGQVTKAWA